MDEAQSPLFLIYMEEYLRGVQSTLTEWIVRGLKQVCRSAVLAATWLLIRCGLACNSVLPRVEQRGQECPDL